MLDVEEYHEALRMKINKWIYEYFKKRDMNLQIGRDLNVKIRENHILIPTHRVTILLRNQNCSMESDQNLDTMEKGLTCKVNIYKSMRE